MSKKGVRTFSPQISKLWALPKPFPRPTLFTLSIDQIPRFHASLLPSRPFSTSSIKMSGLETILTKDACPRKPPILPSFNTTNPPFPRSRRPLQPSHQSGGTSLGRRADPRRHLRDPNRGDHRREDGHVLQEP